MTASFPRIAYETVEICNGVDAAAVDAAILRTGLPPGARTLDAGTGNASVAIRLAHRFGFEVTAVELNDQLAALARDRIAGSGVADRIRLVRGRIAEVLPTIADQQDLLVIMGATNVSGVGRPTPLEDFRFLRARVRPGSWILWGDIVWTGEPAAPLRQLVEVTNVYADDAGWKAAAAAAGLELVWSDISPDEVYQAFGDQLLAGVRAWLTENPDAPGADAVRFDHDRVKAMFDFGRGVTSFGLYLLRRPLDQTAQAS